MTREPAILQESSREEGSAPGSRAAEAERRLSLIVDSIDDGFYALDASWRFTHLNEAALAHFGRARADMLGRSLLEVFPAVRGSVFEREYGRAMETGEAVHFTAPSVVADRTIEVHVYPGPGNLTVLFRDVTEQRRMEEALRDTRERLQVLSEAMPQLVWSADALGSFDYFNPRAYDYAGVRPDVVRGDWAPFVHPDDVEATLGLWRRSIETGETYVIEHRLRRADGEFRWHLTRGVPVQDRAGRVARWIGTSTDIHDQKEAEVRFRSLFDNTSDGVWFHGVDGRIREVNDAYCRMSGYRHDELVGMPISTVEVIESAHDIAEHIQKVIAAGGHDRFESKHRRKDGSFFDVDITALYLHREDLMAIFIRDITARKRAEDALRASEQELSESRKRYQALVETNVDFIWETDTQGRYTYCSPQMEKLWGLKPEKMIGETPFDVMPPDQREISLRNFLAIAKSPTPFIGLETTALDGAGNVIYLETSGVPFFDESGAVLGFRGTTRDVTERNRAEEALRQANARLTEADLRKNRFLATLSHELRNPLAPVKNSLYVLSHAVPGGDQARRARDVIERQVDQLSRLVDDLLDVTRITHGKIQLQRRRLELNDLVKRTIEDNRSLFEESELEVRLEAAPQQVFIDADWNRVAQVLGNLLQNAAKFTPVEGRVTVAVSVDRAARQAVVRVADDGTGMAPEILAHLFEPFMQADATLARSTGGLGLGLALAKGLVEQHGGTIEARSEGLGRGSEFTLRLPLDLAQPFAAELEPSARSKARRRVLVIEDSADAADSLREALEIGGHHVTVAYNGPDGVARARELRPEFVFCDIGLPGMDGYEVARTLRADESLRSAHLVALSGYALPEDVQRAYEAGFERHLAKPPSIEKLQDIMSDDPQGPGCLDT